MPGIASVQVNGGRVRELRVELIQERLVGLGVSADEVVAALGRDNRNVSAGDMVESGREVLVRTMGELTSDADIRCSVVVPVHGSPGVTARCLDAVLATVPGYAEVVVVDDGSPAGTAEALARYDGRIDLVIHRTAAGYATACNAGAAAATGGLLVFLNSDTVPQAGWLDALVREADRQPEAAVVGNRLLFPDGTIQHAGVVIVCDGTPAAAKRIERVLWNDPGTGVMRHADAGYPIAIECAREQGLKLPFLD